MTEKEIEEILSRFRIGEDTGIEVSREQMVSHEYFNDYTKTGGPAGDESWTNRVIYKDDRYLLRSWGYRDRRSGKSSNGRILYCLSDEERKYNVGWNKNYRCRIYKNLLVEICTTRPYIVSWDKGRSFSIFNGNEKGKVICSHLWGHELEKIEEYFGEPLEKVYLQSKEKGGSQ